MMDKLADYANTGDPSHLTNNHCFYPIYQFLHGGLFLSAEARHDFIRALIYWDLHTTIFWTSWEPRNLAQYCIARKDLKNIYDFDSLFMKPIPTPTDTPPEENLNIPLPKMDLMPRYLDDLCNFVQEMECPIPPIVTEEIKKTPARRGRPRKQNTTVTEADLTTSL